MMFRLNPAPTFAATAHISAPGLAQPLALSLTFRHKTAAQAQAWLANAGQSTDEALLGDVLAGWSGVQDDAGADVPYSPAALAELLNNYPAAKGEIFRTYLRELTESKAKN